MLAAEDDALVFRRRQREGGLGMARTLRAKRSGVIVRHKPKNVLKDQEWYWSKQWQEWERQADGEYCLLGRPIEGPEGICGRDGSPLFAPVAGNPLCANQIPKLAYILPHADCNSTLSCLDMQILF